MSEEIHRVEFLRTAGEDYEIRSRQGNSDLSNEKQPRHEAAVEREQIQEAREQQQERQK